MQFPIVTLRTERLRPFQESDASDVHTVWNDEDFLRSGRYDLAAYSLIPADSAPAADAPATSPAAGSDR
jgi:hypothetical protein